MGDSCCAYLIIILNQITPLSSQMIFPVLFRRFVYIFIKYPNVFVICHLADAGPKLFDPCQWPDFNLLFLGDKSKLVFHDLDSLNLLGENEAYLIMYKYLILAILEEI